MESADDPPPKNNQLCSLGGDHVRPNGNIIYVKVKTVRLRYLYAVPRPSAATTFISNNNVRLRRMHPSV